MTLETTGGVIARSVVLNLLVHAAAYGIGFVIFEFLSPDIAVNPDYITALSQAGVDMSAGYGQASGDAIAILRNWWGVAVVLSLVASSLWLLLADLRRPTSPSEARSARGMWLGFFFLAAVLIGAFGYYYFEFRRDAQLQLLGVLFLTAQKVRPRLLAEVVAGAAVTAMLGYYFGTAVGIKRAMRPSVPLATWFMR
jgi:hypothetical protein